MECQNHWFVYNERMSVESCAQAVSNLAIQFGDSDDDSGTAMSRPFGVAVMFAGNHISTYDFHKLFERLMIDFRMYGCICLSYIIEYMKELHQFFYQGNVCHFQQQGVSF